MWHNHIQWSKRAMLVMPGFFMNLAMLSSMVLKKVKLKNIQGLLFFIEKLCFPTLLV